MAKLTIVQERWPLTSLSANFLRSLTASMKSVTCGSGSGNSANVINGLVCAKESGCRTVAVTGIMSGSEGGEIAHIADLALIAPTSSMERTEDIQLVINHIIKEAVKAHNGL